MAKTSKIMKALRLKAEKEKSLLANKKPYKPTRVRNICSICGRPRGYIRLFNMCRICLKFKIYKGEIPGVRKSSW